MTRSPTWKFLTPWPIDTICPAVSWPKILGAECEPVAIFFRSVPHMPQVCTRIRTSPGPISGTGTVSRRTSSLPRYTAACMVCGTTKFLLLVSDLVTVAIRSKPLKPQRIYALKTAQFFASENSAFRRAKLLHWKGQNFQKQRIEPFSERIFFEVLEVLSGWQL